MGSNSKTSHASHVVAPTDAAAPPAAGTGVLEPELSPELIDATIHLNVAMDKMLGISLGDTATAHGYPEPPEDPVEAFEAFAAHIAEAKAAIEEMQAAGASKEEVDAALKALRVESETYLMGLDTETLRKIAAAQGFEHPALSGLSPHVKHPLVHWLDPYYDAGIPSKQHIQDKALGRYQQLLAGETVAGMTLADLHQLEGTDPPPTDPAVPPGMWSATPDQFQASFDAWNQTANAVAYSKGTLEPEKLQALLDAEKQVLTAHCPEKDDLATVQAQVKIWTEDPFGYAKVHASTVLPLVHEAVAAGELSQTEADHLHPMELVARMRAGTDQHEKDTLAATAQARKDKLAALGKALDVHMEGKHDASTALALPALAEDPDAAAKVAAWAENTGTVLQLQQDAQEWVHQTLAGPANHWGLLTAHQVDPQELTKEFNAWSLKQSVADLRQVAAQLGMPDTEKATRSHLRQYIAGAFNPAIDQDGVNAAVQKAAANKQNAANAKAAASAPDTSALASPEAVAALQNALAAAAPTSTPSAPGGLTQEAMVAAAVQMGASPVQAQQLAQASPTGKPVPKAPAQPAAPGSFQGKVQALVANLQHLKATSNDIPVRMDSNVVKSWEFGAGTAAHLGGKHSKSLHSAPDGSNWLFKPDHVGALAHSEATASHLLSLGGVPAVPVYVKEVGGQFGSIQPMLKGAKPLSGNPKTWSQSQVDSIVRAHVGSWLVGDHDGHADNMLQTPSGGTVNIDRGQAFKFWGTDKLSLSYAPPGNDLTPVHRQLYNASLSGGLGEGVSVNPLVAQPIIANFEKISDAQWRALLHSTAHAGAKAGSGVHWVPAMRERAAAKHGVSSAKVTADQIAEAFLDHAVERKHTLRAQFAAFFVDDLKMPHAAALKHGAK
ncbi:MAG: hypothetical protein HOV68_05335 [Streptomycetaceae bacterium]|nr:hypothetical protein [Streptomycetaceae bacterium]